jgi:hypothetical protein
LAIGGGGVRLRESDHDFRVGLSDSWESTLLCLFGEGLGERPIEGRDENKLEELGTEDRASNVDGPGPGAFISADTSAPSVPGGFPPADASAAAAAACFFFSSASFR